MKNDLDEILVVPDLSTPTKKRRYVEKTCREFASHASQRYDLIGNSYLNGIYGKRRKHAVLHSLERAEREFASFGLRSVAESFTHHELNPVNNYNEIDFMQDIRVGAALWMLDRLRAAGKLQEAIELLQAADYEIDFEIAAVPPDFHHSCYDNELIEAVVNAIMKRYKTPAIITEENARGVAPTGRYCRLIALIPEEEVKKADATFKAKVWELAERNMKGQGCLDRELMRTAGQLKDAVLGARALFSSTEGKESHAPAAGPLAKSPLDGVNFNNPNTMKKLLWGEPVIDDENWFEQPGPFFDSPTRTLAREGQNVVSRIRKYTNDFDLLIRMDEKEILEETGSREMTDALANFMVEDPFEICFALIHLIDSGDDAPWLMRSGSSLVFFAQQMLPWYIDWNEWTDEQFEAWLDGLEYNCNGWMEKETPPEKIDYYHEKHKGLNLAQVVYRLCRYVPPVGLHPFETEREQMIEDGMEEAKACKLSDMAELMFLHSFQAKLYRRPRHYDSKEEEEAEKAKLEKEQESLTHAIDSLKKEIAKYGQQGEADVTQEDVTREYENDESEREEESDIDIDLQKTKTELDAAKKQIKKLREELAETQRDAARRQAEAERELKHFRMEHRELADLRELLFNRQEIPSSEEKTESHIAYPYQTRRRTVVFGGHESFLKVIKPMLPTVRFVDVENAAFNQQIIRHADVVWIQNNCISHTQYWSVVNRCKLAGVQLRYFAFASAEKCAEQLALEDQKER